MSYSETNLSHVALGFSAPIASITKEGVRAALDSTFGHDHGMFYTEDGNTIGTYVFGVSQPVARVAFLIDFLVGATKLTDGVVWAACYIEGSDSPSNFLVRTALDSKLREVDIDTFDELAKAAIGV